MHFDGEIAAKGVGGVGFFEEGLVAGLNNGPLFVAFLHLIFVYLFKLVPFCLAQIHILIAIEVFGQLVQEGAVALDGRQHFP